MNPTLRDMIRRQGAFLFDDGLILHFGSEKGEYEAATTSSAIVDLSLRGRIELQGKDRAKLLHNLCTQDVNALRSGRSAEAFFLDAKGHIVDAGVIHAEDSRHWIDLEPDRARPLLAHLDRYVIREDVRLREWNETAFFHVTGPSAKSLLSSLGASLSADEEGVAEPARIQGLDVLLIRRARSWLPGYDILLSEEHSPDVWAAINRAGAAPMGISAADMLRIEAGVPVFGKDIFPDNLPQEIGRNEKAISFTKGCYIGQETVARLDALGHVNRLLTGLLVDAAASPKPGSEVLANDNVVGKVTSSTFSRHLGTPIALAMLKVSARQPGTKLIVDCQAGRVDAVPTPLPFAPSS